MNSVKPQASARPLINAKTGEAYQARRAVGSVSTWLLGAVVVTSMTLVGCNKSTNVDASQDTSSTPSKAEDSKATATTEALTKEPEVVSGEAAGAAGNPVQYNVASWSGKKVDKIKMNDLETIQSGLGKVVSTDKNSLDYASNPATKYRFMADDAAYLDLIDSQKYLELGWYYANPTDTDAEKDVSISHAKKAHQFARELMGDEGGKVVADMLSGQILKNTTVGGQKIELAKCEFYSCMLVLAKPNS